MPQPASPQVPDALDVIRKIAEQRHAPLTLVGEDWKFEGTVSSLDGQEFKIWSNEEKTRKFHIRMLGFFQVQNAATAYAALQIARKRGLRISEKSIKLGFEKTFWPARFEVVRKDSPIIMDSFIKLHQALDEYFPGRKVILIFGVSEDKDVETMLLGMKPVLSNVILTRSTHPRALEPEKLTSLAEKLRLPYISLPSVSDSFERALELSQESGDIILSAGSMFVTAEVRIAWLKYTNAWDYD